MLKREEDDAVNFIPLLYIELKSESEELLCSQTFLCDLLSGKGRATAILENQQEETQHHWRTTKRSRKN